jgi:hypothetical protein
MCWPYHQAQPPTALVLAVATVPRGLAATLSGESYLVPGALVPR